MKRRHMEDEYTEINNGGATALVRKVRRKNGARLEVFSPELDQRVYLDALLLESISWQTPETFAESLEGLSETARTTPEDRIDSEDEYVEIGNEFATALVRKVRAGDGARLEIFSPKLDYRVYLDPSLLEGLARQTPDTLSKLLEEPYGPRGTHEPDGTVEFE